MEDEQVIASKAIARAVAEAQKQPEQQCRQWQWPQQRGHKAWQDPRYWACHETTNPQLGGR